MKIKVLKRFNNWDEGTVVEVDDAKAHYFINAGLAREVKARKAPKKKVIEGPQVKK